MTKNAEGSTAAEKMLERIIADTKGDDEQRSPLNLPNAELRPDRRGWQPIGWWPVPSA